MKKLIPIEQAVGMVLSHDVTQIIRGKYKGAAFRKGHIIQPEDIPKLLDMGKKHIYALEIPEGWIHENDAAQRIAQAAAGNGITLTEPYEGRINLIATTQGLLTINVAALEMINSVEDIVFSTLHTHQEVVPNKPVAGTRIIPLITKTSNIEAVEDICRTHFPVIQIKPFKPATVGIVTTGSEVYHGRITDTFGPVIKSKFRDWGCTVLRQSFVSDDKSMTVNAIIEMIRDGIEIVAVTGGMSVDPDDQTPHSIREAGAQVVVYGAPVFPGAMFMLAYIGNVPILGLPGCMMYFKTSILDLVVPRILAGERLTKSDFVKMGHGGFCRGCDPCRYPACAFGK